MDYTHRYESPLGGITLASDGESLIGLWFDGQKYFAAGLDETSIEKALPVFGLAERWLDLYFGGSAPDHVPPLRPRGTAFQQAVWQALLTVPFGHTATYGEIARALAAQRGLARLSARAVGGAVSRNPVSIIIPCHRVLGADGGLTGYAGGAEKKAWLLAHEHAGA
ncbi:MAG: methylated-DNA--[Clostridia bacterium]|nr:methylated-DNA--[protein]-cysteine S-methyltransferase [Clostridia bacterium]